MGAESTRLVVIGGGPGGYAAAFLAADLGIETTLVDLEANPGGVCLYRGCIPSKTLLHVARVVDEARHAERFGVSFGKPAIDLDRLRSHKDSVVARMTGGLGQLVAARKIRYVRGRAKFVSAGALDVALTDGGSRRLAFEHAVVATGSSPARLPGFPEHPDVLDSSGALELRRIPRTLLVVGGGYIGLELGSVYAALGSEVTVVETTATLLPGVDPDLVRPLHRRLAAAFAGIVLNTRVEEVIPRARKGLDVRTEGDSAWSGTRSFEQVLVSVGRTPNSRGLGLESTAVRVGSSGFVEVDRAMRTAEPSIRAIGDLVGQPMLAHKASHEARVAVESIAGRDVVFEPRAIPAVVFTDPEIAWAGLTETEARAQGRTVAVARFPWGASGRATTLGRDDGVTKLVIDPDSERVLGVGLCGPGAGELIAEGALALEMGAVAEDLAATIHPHPTLSETVMEAAEAFFGTATHIHRPRHTGGRFPSP